MNLRAIVDIAGILVLSDKAILVMDQCTSTRDSRFGSLDIPQTGAVRRDDRELIVTTPGLGEFLRGTILTVDVVKDTP